MNNPRKTHGVDRLKVWPTNANRAAFTAVMSADGGCHAASAKYAPDSTRHATRSREFAGCDAPAAAPLGPHASQNFPLLGPNAWAPGSQLVSPVAVSASSTVG